MNKQQFLTELRGILSFMSEEDRDLTLASFDSLFDSFGKSGEQKLLSMLGSPTKVAVELSRRYLSEGLESALLPFGDLQPAAAPAAAAEPHTIELAAVSYSNDPMQQLAQEVFSDLPAYELSEPENMKLIPDEEPEAVLPEIETAPEAEDTQPAETAPEEAGEDPAHDTEPAAEPAPNPAAETPAEKPAAAAEPAEPAAAAAEPWREQQPHAEKSARTGAVVPLGLGIPIFVFILLVLGLPLAFLFAAAILVLLVPGAAGIGCAYLTAVACLWSIHYVADTVLLIGLALVLLGLGVMVLMGGIWLDVQLCIVYKQAVGWLAGALLGRRRKQ